MHSFLLLNSRCQHSGDVTNVKKIVHVAEILPVMLCHVPWGHAFSIGMTVYELHRFEDTEVLQGAGYFIPLKSERVSFTYFLCMNGYFDGVPTVIQSS
jgi:hypothetical protein